jgi:hypothetical protein
MFSGRTVGRVVLSAWEPKFEITHRRVVRVPEVCGQVRPEYAAIYRLILIEAGMLPDP